MAGILRLGLIGAGRWGRIYIKTVGDTPGVRLHRLASTNPDSRALVPDDCTISEDWRAVATAGDLDGVIIATPPALHGEMAGAAIKAGIPVLIEKPLTTDAAQARAVLALARKNAAIVLVDHIHLYHPAYGELKRQGLGLGKIHGIRGAGGDWGPFRSDVSVLWDRAGHDVALCLDLMGETPESLSASLKERRETLDGPGETLAITLNFPGGVTADIAAGNLMERKKRFLAVHYDHETLIYDDESATPLVREPRPAGTCDQAPGEIIDVANKPPLDGVLDAFAAAIRCGEPDIAGLELGVRVVEVLAVCEVSLRQGGKTLRFHP